MTKRSGLTLENSAIVHATKAMYKRRIVTFGARNTALHVDGACRLSKVGNFKSIGAAEYLAKQPKVRNISGTGDSREGNRTVKAARQLV